MHGAARLGNLFIIDQSLKEVGGHHYDYTCLLARAAVDAGLNPIVGVNSNITPACRTQLSELADVRNTFRETTYSRLSRLAGLQELTKSSTRKSLLPQRPEPGRNAVYNFLGKQVRSRRVKKRSRLIRRFAEDCERLFSEFSIGEEDHILFTTISELEFMGLAAWLGANPRTLQAVWHAQFHFSIYQGKPDESRSQISDLRAIGDCFQHALARVPYHDIRAYTTSEQLTRQYNEMQLLQFDDLPYPIRPELVSPESIDRNLLNFEPKEENYGPLRVTIAGGVRREKGQKDRLNQVIADVWESHVLTGKVQFNVQTNRPKTFNSQQVLGGQQSRMVEPKAFQRMVTAHPHPLPESEYLDLIVNSDIGLFCYDNKRYYSRRAGILCEFLAAGKPVIVPAGCWLSEQIAEAESKHVRSLTRSADDVSELQISELQWDNRNAPAAGGILTFDNTRNPFRCTVDQNSLAVQNATGVAVQFNWQWPQQPGCYVAITATSLDAAGKQIKSEKQITSFASSDDGSIVYFPLPKEFATLELSFRNGCSDSSISIKHLNLQFLEFADQPAPPRSAVGIIAADHEATVAAVDEIVNHYDHYQTSAQQFARTWAWQHHPNRTIECLVGAPHAKASLRRTA